jgi:hypothetical protein
MRNILKILTLSAAAVSVAGCAYGGLGTGYGSPYGYDGYGYSPYGYGGSGVSVSVGYGSPYGGYGYGSPYGYGYGYGSPYYGGYYGSPYFGWYDNFYYPGTGYYVYDVNRRRYPWTDAQRRYWSEQRKKYEQAAGRAPSPAPAVQENWSTFDRNAIRDRAAQNRARTADGGAVVRERTTTQASVGTTTPRAKPTREQVRANRAERVQNRAERRERRTNRDED